MCLPVGAALDKPSAFADKGAMSDTANTATRIPARSLAGASAWVITDGKAGMDVQARGVADALGLDYEMKHVRPQGLQRWLAPWGRVSNVEKFGQTSSPFAPPWPAIAIATGRASIPYIRALRRAAGAGTYTVVLQDPKSGPSTADLIWVPAHDKLRGSNIITTPTAPHSFSQARLAGLRASIPAGIAALPTPRVAIVLGGKNSVYKFTGADDERLAGALASLTRLHASFMITLSRRTHERLMAAVEGATRGSPRIIWDGMGENPYPQFLAHADALVVTADSVNMTGEACATGKPVYVFIPSAGSPKFDRFHKALNDCGATRPLPSQVSEIPRWDYTPLDSAAKIAAEIEQRWLRRSHMLSGLTAATAR